MRRLEASRIVVASHNKGKLVEIADLIAPFGIEARSAAEYGLPEPEETGTSFEENAFIKALAAATATGLPALSDDSGLAVDALSGAPGVYSADWSFQPDGSRDFDAAMRLVEEKLAEQGAATAGKRCARFVSVICLCWPDGHAEYFRGEVEGHLVWPPRGDRGFGYDPMFQPKGFITTFGEMSGDEKRGATQGEPLSHRARAFAKFVNAQFGPQ